MAEKLSLREQRGQALRRRIFVAAREVFNEKGFHDATLDEIAARVKLAKGSLYHYITSKNELLLECYLEPIQQFVSKLQRIVNSEGSPEARLRKAIAAHVEIAVRVSFTPILIQPKAVLGERHEELARLRHEVEACFLQVIEAGVASGAFTTDNPVVARNLILGSVNWMPYWYRSMQDQVPIKAIITFASHFLLQPLLAPEANRRKGSGRRPPVIKSLQ